MLSGGSGGPEIIRFLKNMTFMIKIRTQKSREIMEKSKNGLKSFSNDPNLMIPGVGSTTTHQISVST